VFDIPIYLQMLIRLSRLA